MEESTVCNVVCDVCQAIYGQAIWTALQPEFGCMPSSQSEWLDIV